MTVNCDKIMAIEDGKNMDEGIREELLSKNNILDIAPNSNIKVI